ncbi:MAG TPA: A/G-specific adenine glycosylase, partial [Planctomycetes bacterium]|nr:A/G-specific adenine glycosylase [Planctomycetota bacterium]
MVAQGQYSEEAISILDWFQLQARDLPWRQMRNPYATWVSEIMLQQT